MGFRNDRMAFIFGLLGNIVSLMVFLAPIPTFYTIYKKKSSKGFQAIPYVVALLSTTLWLFYGLIKSNAFFIIGINSVGCFIETAYLTFFVFYSSKNDKVKAVSLILVVNVAAFGSVMALILFLLVGGARVRAVGWLCAAFGIAVFASPLSIVRRVVISQSVEYMPLPLSIFLTLCATMWFFFGLFTEDFYVALPNVVGFFLGIVQIILYIKYRNKNQEVNPTSSMEVHEFHQSSRSRELSAFDDDSTEYRSARDIEV